MNDELEALRDMTRRAEEKSRLWMEAATNAIVERDQAIARAEILARDLDDQSKFSAHLEALLDYNAIQIVERQLAEARAQAVERIVAHLREVDDATSDDGIWRALVHIEEGQAEGRWSK